MAREWESIICYEDRGDHLHTARWRLAGIATKEGAENTDSGVLWLKTTKSGNTVTADIYKDDGCASANKVASGTVSIAGGNGTGANAAECSVTESESSGISGSFWVHQYTGDDTCGVQVALCVDEDLDALFDGIEGLTGYDSTNGCAEFIRIAGEEVLSAVSRIFRDALGGYGSPEAWFITDASRSYPDLRRIANPAQLRIAAAHKALEVALGRSHQRANATMYSELRDYHAMKYEAAMASLLLALKPGSGDNAEDSISAATVRLARV